jgi:hypothetical protein
VLCLVQKIKGNPSISTLTKNIQLLLIHQPDPEKYFKLFEHLHGGKYFLIQRLITSLSLQNFATFLDETICATLQLRSTDQATHFQQFIEVIKVLLAQRKPDVNFLKISQKLVQSAELAFKSEVQTVSLELLREFLEYAGSETAEEAEVPLKKSIKTLKSLVENKVLASDPQILEIVLQISRELTKPTNLEKLEVTEVFALTYVNFINNLIRIIRKCPDQENLVCTQCPSVRKHTVNQLLNGIIEILLKLVKKGTLNSLLSHTIWKNVEYKFTIVEELRCESKTKWHNENLRIVYNTLQKFKDKPQLIAQHFEVIQNYFRLLLNCSAGLESPLVTARHVLSVVETFAQSLTIEQHFEEKVRLSLSAIAYYQQLGNETKRVWSMMVLLRQAIEKAGKASVLPLYSFLEPKSGLRLLLDPQPSQFILDEMLSLYRYQPNTVDFKPMFERLLAKTKDPIILARALHCFTDEKFRELDQKVIIELRNSLMKCPIRPENSLEIHGTLFLIFYQLFNCEYADTKQKLKGILEAQKSDQEKKEDIRDVTREVNVKTERKMLENLQKSLKYFAKFLASLEDAGITAGENLRIPSSRKLLKVVENIGVQFLLRGFADRMVESFKLMLRFAGWMGDEMKILMTLTYLLDHSGLLVEDYWPVLEEKARKLEGFVAGNYQGLDANKKAHVLVHLLARILHHSRRAQFEESKRLAQQFDELYQKLEITESTQVFVATINAKFHFTICQMIFAHPAANQDQQDPLVHMKQAVDEIRASKGIETDFSNQIQAVWFLVSIAAVKFYLDHNSNVDLLKYALLTMELTAKKYGFAVRFLEVAANLAAVNLSAENVEKSEVSFFGIFNIFLGVETGSNFVHFIGVGNWAHFGTLRVGNWVKFCTLLEVETVINFVHF